MLNRGGMTFVDLLLVLTIVGLLATIAMPSVKHVKDRSLVGTIKHDLRAFAVHQESHRYDHASYTDDVAALRAGGFRTSPDVVISVNEATALGWSATAEHAHLLVQCYLFVGDASPIGAATDEGNLECS